jgi:hypothetical protein
VCICAAPRFVGQHQTHLGWAKGQSWKEKKKKQAILLHCPVPAITTMGTYDVRASPTVPSMWSCRVKLDEENPTYAGLAHENGFGVHLQKRV